MCDHEPKEKFVEYTFQGPCQEGLVVGAGARVCLGPYRKFRLPKPSSGDDRDPGGPYTEGQRVRRFGGASFREVLAAPTSGNGGGLENKTCFIESTQATLRIDSSNGCGLAFVAVLPGERLPSFAVWTSTECLSYRLYSFSTKAKAWAEIAGDRSCG